MQASLPAHKVQANAQAATKRDTYS